MKYITDIKAKTNKLNIRYLESLKKVARNNRSKPTQAEFIMWQHLRKNKFGCKFTRQKPINRFVLDFYCSKLLLCIEIDGSAHNERQQYDKQREECLSDV